MIIISIVYRKAFIERINNIYENGFRDISHIEHFPQEAAQGILVETLETGAISGNHANIELAREFIVQFPESWLLAHLPQAVAHCLFKEPDWQEWEFRRVAEMLQPHFASAFAWFVQYAQHLNNVEVDEAIADFTIEDCSVQN